MGAAVPQYPQRDVQLIYITCTMKVVAQLRGAEACPGGSAGVPIGQLVGGCADTVTCPCSIPVCPQAQQESSCGALGEQRHH